MTRHIRLCADDFALDVACTNGIINLFAQNRLSATSCLVESALWPDAARTAHAAEIAPDALGLHFNLTEGLDDDDLPLRKLLLKSLTGRLDPTQIARRLECQLDLFEHHWGNAPAHVDGHQHVHILPGIRPVVLEVLRRRYRHSLPHLRSIHPMSNITDTTWKRHILTLLGTGFSRDAAKLGFPINRGFAGVYSLSADADYPYLITNWLDHSADGMELMCHPADGNASSHAVARQREYDYLISPTFANLMGYLGLVTNRKPTH